MSDWVYKGDYSYKGDIVEGALTLSTGISESDPYVQHTYELQDIAQSHHFTITLDKINIEFPTEKFGYFLPVHSISYTQSVYDNMNIPVGIFGDINILRRKQVSKLNLTLYDLGTDPIEAKIKAWENECYPKGKYVNYLSEIVGELVYTSFSPDGKRNKSITMYVIPAGDFSVRRSYEENAPKFINFGVVVIGFKGSMTGSGTSLGGSTYGSSSSQVTSAANSIESLEKESLRVGLGKNIDNGAENAGAARAISGSGLLKARIEYNEYK